MIQRKSLPALEEDRLVRPRIKQRPHLKSKAGFVYRSRTTPVRLIAMGTLMKGLFEEILHGTSVTRLYAGLLAQALIDTGDARIKRTYARRLKQLSQVG